MGRTMVYGRRPASGSRRGSAIAAALTVLALAGAACSDGGSNTPAAGAGPTTSARPGNGQPADGPDRATGILVQPTHDALIVRGDDGKDHVEYQLLVVNT